MPGVCFQLFLGVSQSLPPVAWLSYIYYFVCSEFTEILTIVFHFCYVLGVEENESEKVASMFQLFRENMCRKDVENAGIAEDAEMLMRFTR